MQNNLKTEKGSASTAIIALVILAVFLGAGAFVYYHSDNQLVATKNNDELPSYTASSSSVASAIIGSGVETKTELKTVYEPAHTEVVTRPSNPFPGGPVYHNSTYGLTVPLPAGWSGYSIYQNVEYFGGFPSLVSLHFNVGGTNPLTVNVFTKEQWNDIRNQENANHLNVNSLGEGIYLGENFTYIFSTQTPGASTSTILPYILFY